MTDVDFSDVRARLTARDVFTDPSHNWKTQGGRRWKGGCPWHESSSGACFTVNPETLEWHCFSCDRGGGPLEYVAELEGIGGVTGKDFFRAWDALSEHAGCEGPPDFSEGQGSGTRSKRDRRRPLQRVATRTPAPRKATAGQVKDHGETVRAPDGHGSASTSSGDAPPYSERELRAALVRYRTALEESTTDAAHRARAYIEERGLSVDTLHRYGCGIAEPGEWLEDNVLRIVTPHTTPSGRLINLYGRAAGVGKDYQKHRHLKGTKGLFNAAAITGGTGPLVVCESSIDALSFIEAGHARTVAVHGKTGLPWRALRGNVRRIVFALDADARDDAMDAAREAVLRGFEAHVLPEDAFGGAGDPNEALVAGTLDLSPIRQIHNPGSMASQDGAHDESAAPAGDLGTPQVDDAGSEWPMSERLKEHGDGFAPADPSGLIPYWNGTDTGHLGAWLWTRSAAPMGRVDDALTADIALHRWIVAELERGPGGARNPERLESVLWRLYAAFSGEGSGPPPTVGATVSAPFGGAEQGATAPGTVREVTWSDARRTWRVAVAPDDGQPSDTAWFCRPDVTAA